LEKLAKKQMQEGKEEAEPVKKTKRRPPPSVRFFKEELGKKEGGKNEGGKKDFGKKDFGRKDRGKKDFGRKDHGQKRQKTN